VRQFFDAEVLLWPRKNGEAEEPDYYRLRDKNGGFILCYRCRKSALKGKPIIACDYCDLHWHLDCLDPPLASAPNTSRKWMCPNHAEMAMVSWTQSVMRNPELSLIHLHHYRMLGNGNGEILLLWNQMIP
jgi:hypothetical protein